MLVVIWTTTPWTMPGNRAISYSHKIDYGLYRVTARRSATWAEGRRRTICSRTNSRTRSFKAAKVEASSSVGDVSADALTGDRPARIRSRVARATTSPVPLLDGDHVTDDTGTGFVHTAPGHGRDDFDIWMANGRAACRSAASTRASLTPSMPTASSPRTRRASKASASSPTRATRATPTRRSSRRSIEAGNLVARGRLKHQYPHSWRSKKPVIFRNTPQWFIAMDKPFDARRGDAMRRRCARSRYARSAARNGCRPLAKTASPA